MGSPTFNGNIGGKSNTPIVEVPKTMLKFRDIAMTQGAKEGVSSLIVCDLRRISKHVQVLFGPNGPQQPDEKVMFMPIPGGNGPKFEKLTPPADAF
mmetsp:Transcript_2522/g.5310  ORF Transcript_2522/g.5310 Transcript_2522/m.5310 type:complete len:96 (+) Transcript_2522:93-380(+)